MRAHMWHCRKGLWVGSIGAGKSTLMSALFRLLEAHDGGIHIDSDQLDGRPAPMHGFLVCLVLLTSAHSPSTSACSSVRHTFAHERALIDRGFVLELGCTHARTCMHAHTQKPMYICTYACSTA